MSNQLGPIDVCCDAPPYPIVKACAQLGFLMPEDVRWCQMSHLGDQGLPADSRSPGWRDTPSR
jgi:hypothetical protein